jgi:extradiol dioxygenase family protein
MRKITYTAELRAATDDDMLPAFSVAITTEDWQEFATELNAKAIDLKYLAEHYYQKLANLPGLTAKARQIRRS